jgi:hypothetical protein
VREPTPSGVATIVIQLQAFRRAASDACCTLIRGVKYTGIVTSKTILTDQVVRETPASRGTETHLLTYLLYLLTFCRCFGAPARRVFPDLLITYLLYLHPSVCFYPVRNKRHAGVKHGNTRRREILSDPTLEALHEVLIAARSALSVAVRAGSARAPALVASRRDRRHRQRDLAAYERSGAQTPRFAHTGSDACVLGDSRTELKPRAPACCIEFRRATRWTRRARSCTRSATTASMKVRVGVGVHRR